MRNKMHTERTYATVGHRSPAPGLDSTSLTDESFDLECAIRFNIAHKYVRGILRPESHNIVMRGAPAIVAEHCVMDDTAQGIFEMLQQQGIQNPILHGGAIREKLLGALLDKDTTVNDFDIKANLAETPVYGEKSARKLAHSFQKAGCKLKLVEVTPDIVIIKMTYGENQIDLVMGKPTHKWDAPSIAVAGHVSVSSAAMDKTGTCYVDPYFIGDAQKGNFRFYWQDSPESIPDAHKKLQRYYPGHFRRVFKGYREIQEETLASESTSKFLLAF